MVIRLIGAYLLVCACSYASFSYAEPFGLKIGAAGSELALVKDEGSPKGMFRFTEVAQPRPEYGTYIGQFSNNEGLCWIKAIGHDVPSDALGTQIKALFEIEQERLASLYGAVKNFDFRFSGRSDEDMENWLQAVSEGDRYVAAIWNRENGSILPDDLESVGLVLNAYTSSMAYLSLEYTFNNIVLCEQELTLVE
ncbi:MAG: hypothetical protein AB8B84_12210 [Granulosicoccus sp.]